MDTMAALKVAAKSMCSKLASSFPSAGAGATKNNDAISIQVNNSVKLSAPVTPPESISSASSAIHTSGQERQASATGSAAASESTTVDVGSYAKTLDAVKGHDGATGASTPPPASYPDSEETPTCPHHEAPPAEPETKQAHTVQPSGDSKETLESASSPGSKTDQPVHPGVQAPQTVTASEVDKTADTQPASHSQTLCQPARPVLKEQTTPVRALPDPVPAAALKPTTPTPAPDVATTQVPVQPRRRLAIRKPRSPKNREGATPHHNAPDRSSTPMQSLPLPAQAGLASTPPPVPVHSTLLTSGSDTTNKTSNDNDAEKENRPLDADADAAGKPAQKNPRQPRQRRRVRRDKGPNKALPKVIPMPPHIKQVIMLPRPVTGDGCKKSEQEPEVADSRVSGNPSTATSSGAEAVVSPARVRDDGVDSSSAQAAQPPDCTASAPVPPPPVTPAAERYKATIELLAELQASVPPAVASACEDAAAGQHTAPVQAGDACTPTPALSSASAAGNALGVIQHLVEAQATQPAHNVSKQTPEIVSVAPERSEELGHAATSLREAATPDESSAQKHGTPAKQAPAPEAVTENLKADASHTAGDTPQHTIVDANLETAPAVAACSLDSIVPLAGDVALGGDAAATLTAIAGAPPSACDKGGQGAVDAGATAADDKGASCALDAPVSCHAPISPCAATATTACEAPAVVEEAAASSGPDHLRTPSPVKSESGQLTTDENARLAVHEALGGSTATTEAAGALGTVKVDVACDDVAERDGLLGSAGAAGVEVNTVVTG